MKLSEMVTHYIVEGVMLAFVVWLYWWAFKEDRKE